MDLLTARMGTPVTLDGEPGFLMGRVHSTKRGFESVTVMVCPNDPESCTERLACVDQQIWTHPNCPFVTLLPDEFDRIQ